MTENKKKLELMQMLKIFTDSHRVDGPAPL